MCTDPPPPFRRRTKDLWQETRGTHVVGTDRRHRRRTERGKTIYYLVFKEIEENTTPEYISDCRVNPLCLFPCEGSTVRIGHRTAKITKWKLESWCG